MLGEFKHGVEPVGDGHGKYHVAVLAPDKEIPEYAVGDVQMKSEMVAGWLCCKVVSSLPLIPF